ncbi:MAG TPA: hypothetical protein VIL20_07540 [Sandaracinaceae bacterium]
MSRAPRQRPAARLRAPVWVIKLGGSLAESGALRHWLDAVAAAGRGRAVVVPGGGRFADQVRAAQAQARFDDRAAHRMALLAMEQYAVMLCALAPTLAPVKTPRGARRALARGRAAVWLPSAYALAACPLPASWGTTSDSLAGWFAWQLGARCLVLVKSLPLVAGAAPARALSAAGIVDRVFPRVLARARIPTLLLGPGDAPHLEALLRGDRARRHLRVTA